jgi:CheY-like chemotaxis protein
LHDGHIAASSAGLGQGSTFTVTLPVRELPAEENRKRTAPLRSRLERTVGAKTLHGVKILLVDDEADSRDFLTQVLRSAGAEVISATSCREAIDIFAHSAPDVLLSDIGLPEEDGYSLIQEIRALPHDKGGRVPAAALTAYTRPEDATRALEAGFDLHVPKPIEPFEVIGVVADLAQLQR